MVGLFKNVLWLALVRADNLYSHNRFKKIKQLSQNKNIKFPLRRFAGIIASLFTF